MARRRFPNLTLPLILALGFAGVTYAGCAPVDNEGKGGELTSGSTTVPSSSSSGGGGGGGAGNGGAGGSQVECVYADDCAPLPTCKSAVCIDNQCVLVDAPDGASCGGAWQTCLGGVCGCNPPSTLCNGVCTDITGDPESCGGCGLTCPGSACIAGTCAPFQPVEIAAGQPKPVSIAVDATHVYWTNQVYNEPIYKTPINGGAIVPLGTPKSEPWHIATDGVNVYYTSSHVVERIPVGGGAPAPLTGVVSNPWGITVDAAHVYWTNQDQGYADHVWKVPTGGGPASTFVAAGPHDPLGVKVDTTHVYYVGFNGAIRRVNKDATNLTLLTEGLGEAHHLAVDATDVYWACTNGAIAKVSIYGGDPVVLASDASGPWGIAVDAGYVYWTNRLTNKVQRVPKAGGAVTELATNQAEAFGIAVDATNVYWTNRSGGSVMKLAK